MKNKRKEQTFKSKENSDLDTNYFSKSDFWSNWSEEIKGRGKDYFQKFDIHIRCWIPKIDKEEKNEDMEEKKNQLQNKK